MQVEDGIRTINEARDAIGLDPVVPRRSPGTSAVARLSRYREVTLATAADSSGNLVPLPTIRTAVSGESSRSGARTIAA
jgi:hypothetical protein